LDCRILLPPSSGFENITNTDSGFDFLLRIPEVKFTVEEAMKAQRVQLYPFFNFGCRWNWWSTPCPGHYADGKETRYECYRSLGVPQGISGNINRLFSSLFQNGCVADQTSFLYKKNSVI